MYELITKVPVSSLYRHHHGRSFCSEHNSDRRDLRMNSFFFFYFVCSGDDNFKGEETKPTEPATAAVSALTFSSGARQLVFTLRLY